MYASMAPPTVIRETCFMGIPKKVDPADGGALRRVMATSGWS
jgi:hypothetical protein